MISHSGRKWIAVVYLLAVPSVDPQMMFPMYPPPVHVGVPMPFPMPMMVQGTAPTTTTTETPDGVGFMPMPMPMAMPAPFAFPAFPSSACQAKEKTKSCPPCPPCVCVPACTPAFFSYCSPCHKKCRCRSKEDTPTPIPPPVMGAPFGVAVPMPPMFAPPPPPVVVMPFPPPPLNRRRPNSCDSSECDTDTESEECSSSDERSRRRRNKYGRYRRIYGRRYRRQFDSVEVRGKELVKPVLTYLSRDGNVKLKRRLTNDEAAELMNEKPYKVHVVTGEDNSNMPKVSIISNPKMNSGGSHRRRQMVISPGAAQQMIGEGKKELVFRPPSGKKISNLSVSFQISE